MRVSWSLPLVFLGGLAAAVMLPRDLSKFAVIATGVSIAWLLLAPTRARRADPEVRPSAPGAPRRWILVDGSNVLHWRDNTPSIATVGEAVVQLSARGLDPVVVFDANVGYLIAGRYLRGAELARVLGLPRAQVRVTPKGIPADPILLGAARELGARIVTCDRYRDWAELHPEVQGPGLLVRGGIDGEQLWLELDPPAPSAAMAQGA